MAFSTQNKFLNVPFMNEQPQAKCLPKDGVKLKTYSSTTDGRAWSLSKDERTRYLIDLVACRTYPPEDGAIGDGLVPELRAVAPATNEISDSRQVNVDIDLLHQPHDNLTPAVGDDSLIHAAVEKMTKFENLLSQEPQGKIKKEKDSSHLDMSSVLRKKIDNLKKLSKLDVNDENDFLKILAAEQKLEKAYKAKDAENSYLRQLVEKMSLRSRTTRISVEPENSSDVKYLQTEVNNLRKEVLLLRSYDDKLHNVSKETQDRAGTDMDSENVAKIISERNALRQKCQHLAALEEKIIQWKHNAEQAQSLRYALKKRDEEIEDCHDEIQDLQYELKRIKMKEQSNCSSIGCLKDENHQLREEICRYNCDFSMLQDQLKDLTNELSEKNLMIDQYDVQFEQLMRVVENLKKKDSVDIRSLQDVDSQTHNDHIEDLAATTKATLDQISKELEMRKEVEDELAHCRTELGFLRRECQDKEAIANAKLNEKEIENRNLRESLQKSLAARQSFDEFDVEVRPNDDCAAQVEQLNALIIKIKSEHQNEVEILRKNSVELLSNLESKQQKAIDSEKLYSEIEGLKKSLGIVEEENDSLKTKNLDLNNALINCEKTVRDYQDQLNALDSKANGLSSELNSSKAELNKVEKLVKNINSVQSRNESLKSVLESVDYSEKLQKEISDIKKQLEEEQYKSAQLLEQNKNLQSSLDNAMNAVRSEVKMGESRKPSVAPVNIQSPNDHGSEKSVTTDVQNPEGLEADSVLETNHVQPSKVNRTGKSVKQVLKTPGRLEVDSIQVQPSKINKPDKNVNPGVKTPTQHEAHSTPSGVVGSDKKRTPSEKKSTAKLSQLQMIHNAERKQYEQEIQGHRLSNEVLQKSITKLTTQMESKSAVEFEREFRSILDSFIQEICTWRCAKNCKKLSKIQEISKKILEVGISCLTYKELVYLHQQMSAATLKLRPRVAPGLNSRPELKCCKCSGDICYMPTIPKETEKLLLEKLSILERELQNAKDNLRRLKEEDYEATSTDQEQETMRACTSRLNYGGRTSAYRSRTSRYNAISEELDVPTRD